MPNNPGRRAPHPNTSSGVLNLMPMAAANALRRRTSTIVCWPIGVVECMMHTWEVQQVGPEKTSAYPPDLRGMRYVTGSKQSASVCCVRVLNMVLSLKSQHHMQRGWLIRRQGPPPKQQLYHMHRGWLINRQGPPPTQQLYQQTLTCQSRRGRRPGPLHRPHRSWPSGLQHSMAAHRVVGHNGECTALDTPGPCMQLPLHTCSTSLCQGGCRVKKVACTARPDLGLRQRCWLQSKADMFRKHLCIALYLV